MQARDQKLLNIEVGYIEVEIIHQVGYNQLNSADKDRDYNFNPALIFLCVGMDVIVKYDVFLLI